MNADDSITGTTSLAYSHDGKFLATGGKGSVTLFDKKANYASIGSASEYNDYFLSMHFNAKCTDLFTGSADGTAIIWSIPALSKAATISSGNPFFAATFLPGKLVATSSWESTIRVWDATTGESSRAINEHTDWVMSLAVAGDGSQFVSGSKDKTVKLFNVRTFEVNQTIYCDGVVWRAMFSSGSELLIGLRNQGVGLYHINTGLKSVDVSTQSVVQGIVVYSPKVLASGEQSALAPSNVAAARKSTIDPTDTNVSRNVVLRTVDLTRGPSGLGMKISTAKNGTVVVSEVIKGSVAEASGSIFKDDRLMEINGVDVSKSTQPEVTDMLKKSQQLRIVFEGQARANIRTVTISRETGQILGMRITKGTGQGARVVVVVPDSAAAKSGLIKPQDYILNINGENVLNCSYDEVLKKLTSSMTVTIVVSDILPDDAPAAN